MTAQERAILMARMEGSVLMVEVIHGKRDARFSYRLSGERLDEAVTDPEELNRNIDGPFDHYIDLNLYDRFGNLKR